MSLIDPFLQTIKLEQLDENTFQGNSLDIGSKAVFGGQVLAQSLNAATRTVAMDRFVHSLHAYFILPGDIQKPILYEVDKVRDGRSFTTRRVIAKQNGKAIFITAASFQIEEKGLDHQIEMLNVPHPESLASMQDIIKRLEQEGKPIPPWYRRKNWPIEFRPVEDIDPYRPGRRPPFRHVWFRANGKLTDDKALHRCILAYASDFNLLGAALLPHNVSFVKDRMIIASIDHAMWFHRDFRADEWLLYALDSPSASNARGFSRGNIFNQAGDLVASVTQEGLIRLIGDKK